MLACSSTGRYRLRLEGYVKLAPFSCRLHCRNQPDVLIIENQGVMHDE